MAETELKKVQDLVEAARQRLNFALGRDTWLRRSEHVESADALLAEAQKVLRTGGP